MNDPRRKYVLRLALAGVVLSSWFLPAVARGQDTTKSSTRTGPATVTTQVQSAEVIYVSGNDLVVKTDNGTVRHFVVPDNRKIMVDGKQLTIHDLQPGMKLTRTITTTTTPRTVETIRSISGKVWYVNPPHGLILTLPEGNKQYKVPDGAMFDINGTKQSIFHLRKGMTVSATIVKDSPETDVAETRAVAGEAPSPPPPATPPPPTPPVIGVLLIEAPPAPQQEVAQTTLPKTGSLIPLIGILGLIAIGAAFGLHGLRERFDSHLHPTTKEGVLPSSESASSVHGFPFGLRQNKSAGGFTITDD